MPPSGKDGRMHANGPRREGRTAGGSQVRADVAPRSAHAPVVPGVGPFIAAGTLATTLAGAAAGAGVGAIGGALVGLGVSAEEAAWLERQVRGGGALVAVRAGQGREAAESILRRFGAHDLR